MNKIGVGYASVTELEKKYVMDALESERLSQGKYVAQFEKKFAEMHGTRYGVMNNSGTNALHIAFEALKEVDDWDENTEVLVPAITFIATSNAVIHSGLKVLFVDVDPVTYNINPEEIEKHITKNTKCIVPVHTFGMPCDMERITAISKKYNLRIVEDCAEAHFARIGDKTVGSFSDISAFSTYVAHTITTGIGGISCTNDVHLAEIMRSLVAHGRACTCEVCIASDGKKVCSKRMKTDLDRRFSFERLGFSYRVGELEGALGLAQIERKDEIMDARHKNAEVLNKLLAPYEDKLQLPKEPKGIRHTYMMYPILIKKNSGINRKEFVQYLEKANIETRPMLPLLNQPVYKKIFGEHFEDNYTVAKYINNNGFYVGCHHGMTEKELKYIAETIGDYFSKKYNQEIKENV